MKYVCTWSEREFPHFLSSVFFGAPHDDRRNVVIWLHIFTDAIQHFWARKICLGNGQECWRLERCQKTCKRCNSGVWHAVSLSKSVNTILRKIVHLITYIHVVMCNIMISCIERAWVYHGLSQIILTFSYPEIDNYHINTSQICHMECKKTISHAWSYMCVYSTRLHSLTFFGPLEALIFHIWEIIEKEIEIIIIRKLRKASEDFTDLKHAVPCPPYNMNRSVRLANFSASMVAEVMMSLKSCRLPTTERKTSSQTPWPWQTRQDLKPLEVVEASLAIQTPKRTSVFRERSWASSMMTAWLEHSTKVAIV